LDVALKGAESRLFGRVLLTGYHGDKIWAKDTKDLGTNIVRGDPSGLSLTEYRLWSGFIHCPVPFWGVRQIGDINALSNSSEMGPWDMQRNYSRPLCRRIVEEAGVPRGSFGIEKRATYVEFVELLVESSLSDYMSWLHRSRWHWLRQGKLPPIRSIALEKSAVAARRFFMPKLKRAAQIALRHSAHKPLSWRIGNSNRLQTIARRRLDRPSFLRKYLFPWAMEKAVARYSVAPEALPLHPAVTRHTARDNVQPQY
jgi:hypothetical protein